MARWTQKEYSIIKKYYPTECSAITRRLPNRTLTSIRVTARKLGVKAQKVVWNKMWTAEEESVLRKYYPSEGIRVAARLTNDRSALAIRQRVTLINRKNPDKRIVYLGK